MAVHRQYCLTKPTTKLIELITLIPSVVANSSQAVKAKDKSSIASVEWAAVVEATRVFTVEYPPCSRKRFVSIKSSGEEGLSATFTGAKLHIVD